MYILVINGGSSSLKYQLFDMATRSVMAKGLCERIGLDGFMKHKGQGKPEFRAELPLPDHAVAARHVVEKLTDPVYGVISDMSAISAVGHRIVHGGEYFTESVLVDEDVVRKIADLSSLAPLHNPGHVMGIRAAQAVMGPEVPQVVVFDTAFHQTIPPMNHIFPVKYEYYTKYKVRRYGFHGTSHRYVSQRCAQLMGRPIEELKIVTCHLGNGSSICAVRHGKSFNTSMGFTPLDGLPMGTRSGSIDPAVVCFLLEKEGLTPGEFTHELNKASGFLGICGHADYRDLLNAADAGDEKSILTRDMLTHAIKRYIGSFAADMGGLDAVVFTAGIGENNALLREQVIEGLEFLGLGIDPAKNRQKAAEVDATADGARAKTFVIATDEEMMIALETERLAAAGK